MHAGLVCHSCFFEGPLYHSSTRVRPQFIQRKISSSKSTDFFLFDTPASFVPFIVPTFIRELYIYTWDGFCFDFRNERNEILVLRVIFFFRQTANLSVTNL